MTLLLDMLFHGFKKNKIREIINNCEKLSKHINTKLYNNYSINIECMNE